VFAAAAVAYPPLERKLLLDQPLPETTIRAVKSARIEFAGGQPSGAHLHPGPVFGIVTRGSFIFQVHDRPVRTLHAGDAFYEPANLPIDRFDNASPDQPAEIEAFYLLGSAEQALVEMLPQ
jgi:quercetin dioxygenase-like cupin family protein